MKRLPDDEQVISANFNEQLLTTADGRSVKRLVVRWALALFYIVAGVFHVLAPEPFLQIMPRWVPAKPEVVFWTGIAEIAGALALVTPWSRQVRVTGAIGLALYAICVFPANINHFAIDVARAKDGLGYWYHVPRMFTQPLIVWLTLWSAHLIEWPFGKHRK